MMIKTALVFLALMVLVAMLGRAFFPTATGRIMRRAVPRLARCDSCGRHLIGRTGCSCKSKT